jgi:protein deglycase
MASVLVLLQDGCEEMEAITPIDLLRRAGLEVITASTSTDLEVTGSHAITLKADKMFSEITHLEFDVVLLPGGPGVAELRQNAEVRALLQNQSRRGGKLAAICAAPLVLADAGLLGNREVTSFPGKEMELKPLVKAYRTDRVVVDGPLCTSRGAGTAEEFSLAIIEWILGSEAAEKVRSSILART